MRLSLVNSDTVVAKSNLVHVKYATAALSCKDEIIVDDNMLNVSYVLDYRRLLHPPSDWIGVFAQGERFLSAHHALRKAHIPAKNLGIVSIDPRGLEGPHRVVYFQEFPDRSVTLGHCESVFLPKPPQAPQKFIKSSKPPSELRHVKFYMSGTYKDLEEERKLVLKHVMPRLKPICDARFMSVIFMDMRFGTSQDGEIAEETASEKSGTSLIERCLTELDSCLPYFICVLGNVYGHVPKKLPWRVSQLYPWLSDNRFQNVRVLQGAHMSLTEMEIVNAVLVDPSLAPHARFYMRDPSYALGRGVQFQDTEEWAKVALNLLKVKIRKTVEVSHKINPAKCMALHTYFNPKHFAELLTKDVVSILDMDYNLAHTPSELKLFWLTLDEATSKHIKKTNVQLRRELQALDLAADDIDQLVEAALASGTPCLLAMYGEEGCGKTCLMVRWTQRRVSGASLLSDTGELREKCSCYTCFTDNNGRECVVRILYASVCVCVFVCMCEDLQCMCYTSSTDNNGPECVVRILYLCVLPQTMHAYIHACMHTYIHTYIRQMISLLLGTHPYANPWTCSACCYSPYIHPYIHTYIHAHTRQFISLFLGMHQRIRKPMGVLRVRLQPIHPSIHPYIHTHNR